MQTQRNVLNGCKLRNVYHILRTWKPNSRLQFLRSVPRPVQASGITVSYNRPQPIPLNFPLTISIANKCSTAGSAQTDVIPPILTPCAHNQRYVNLWDSPSGAKRMTRWTMYRNRQTPLLNHSSTNLDMECFIKRMCVALWCISLLTKHLCRAPTLLRCRRLCSWTKLHDVVFRVKY